MDNQIKHYIRIDENSNIIHGFSTAFEQSQESDICINEDGGRHFKLLGEVNPALKDGNGFYNYKYLSEEVIIVPNEEKLYSIEILKGNQIVKIKKYCEQAIYDGFVYNGETYEYDLKDQLRFQTMMIAIGVGQTGTVEWGVVSEDELKIAYDETTFPSLYVASTVHLNTLVSRSRTLIDQVKVASSYSAIKEITWSIE